eukprot:g3124.t1
MAPQSSFAVEHFDAARPANLELDWAALSRKLAASPSAKLLLVVRHGQATHNLGPAKYGWSRWMEVEAKSSLYFDAPLTERGKVQARNASRLLRRALRSTGAGADADGGGGALPRVERVFVSPLTRTLQTAQLVFGVGEAAGALAPLPFEAVELVRERAGVYPCDKRHGRAYLQRSFGSFTSFRHVLPGPDPVWEPAHRETDTEVAGRAGRFLRWVWGAGGGAGAERPGRVLGVVTHSHFIRALYQFLRLAPAPPPANADIVPLLLRPLH